MFVLRQIIYYMSSTLSCTILLHQISSLPINIPLDHVVFYVLFYCLCLFCLRFWTRSVSFVVSDREHELRWMNSDTYFNLIFFDHLGAWFVGISPYGEIVSLLGIYMLWGPFLFSDGWSSFFFFFCRFFSLSLSSIVCAVGSFGWDLSYMFRSAHLGCKSHTQQRDDPSRR